MTAKQADSDNVPWWFALLGLGPWGKYVMLAIFVLTIPALTFWSVFMPRLRFHEVDERLFKAARHGDVAGITRALADGAAINAEAPIDRRTALFRAAAFAQVGAVRALLKAGADAERRGADDRTVLQLTEDARKEEHDGARARAYDQVIAALQEVQR